MHWWLQHRRCLAEKRGGEETASAVPCSRGVHWVPPPLFQSTSQLSATGPISTSHMSKRTQIPLLVTTATATVLSKQNNLIFLKTMERKQYPVDQQVVQWLYMSFHSCLVIVFSLNIKNHTQIYTNISTNDREGVVSFAPRGQSVLDWKGELMQSAWIILPYKKQTTIYVPHLYISLCECSFCCYLRLSFMR